VEGRSPAERKAVDPKMMNQPPRINASPAEAEGEYSNVFFVASSKAEFVLDFARAMPGVPAATLKSRVIISPHRVKALVQALEAQISSYEDRFGPLDSGGPSTFGFQNPTGGTGSSSPQ
jgi:hypothetical protein